MYSEKHQEFRSADENDFIIDEKWWEARGDVHLNLAVEQALRHNESLARTALALYGIIKKVGLFGEDSGEADRTDRDHPQIKRPKYVRTFGGEFCLSYEKLLWEGLSELADFDEWECRATLEDQCAVRAVLVNNVIDAYYHLAYLTDLVEASRAGLKTYNKLLDICVRKKADRFEITRVKKAVQEAERQLAGFQSQREKIKNQLEALLGLPRGGLHNSPQSLMKAIFSPVSLETPLRILAGRPDYKKSAQTLRRALKTSSLSPAVNWTTNLTIGQALELPPAGQMKAAVNETDYFEYRFINFKLIEAPGAEHSFCDAYYDDQLRMMEECVLAALNECDVYLNAYDQARVSVVQSEKKYSSDWVKLSCHRIWSGFISDDADLELSIIKNANTSRLTMLKNRYQALQYENMVYKALFGRYIGA